MLLLRKRVAGHKCKKTNSCNLFNIIYQISNFTNLKRPFPSTIVQITPGYPIY